MEDTNAQSNSPDQTPTTVTPPPAEPVKVELPAPVKAPKKKLGIMVLLFVFVLAIPAAVFAGNKMSTQKSDKKIASLNSQIALLQANEHDLPAGAIKVSDCIPNMGAHYVTKTSDSRYGPFLLVSKKNKVLGIEYMVSKDMYTAIPATNPPVEVVTKDSPMYGWKFDHSEVSHMPKGHEGLEVDHVDVHLYTATQAQRKLACVE